MVLRPRAIQVTIERVIFDGAAPGERARFARAFERACADAFATLELRGGARTAERVEIALQPGVTPEVFAAELARGIARALVR
jgi:hypothetical protein